MKLPTIQSAFRIGLAGFSAMLMLQLHAAEPPLRILSLSAAATDVLLKLGANQELAAIDRFGRIVPGAEEIPQFGQGIAFSREKLLSLGINRVIAWYYQQELTVELGQFGIPVTIVPNLRVANYPEFVRTLGNLVRREAEAERVVAAFETALRAAAGNSARRRPRVYLELYAPFKTAGKASYVNDLVELAGGANVAAELQTASGTISAETVIRQSPEVIFFIEGFGSAAEIAARPGFADLPAVKEKRIYAVNRRHLVTGLAPAEAVGFLHRQIFRENP